MPSTRLRDAEPADVPALVGLRRRLPLHETAVGGFLLDCSHDRFGLLVEHGISVVIVTRSESGEEDVCGFGMVLTDAMLRQSNLWAMRHRAQWENFEPASIEAESIAYFDQLALAPETPRWYAPALGLHLLERAFVQHDHLLATTVVEPMVNQAALPLLRAAGARRVGVIDANFPDFGPMRSALHWISRNTWSRRRGVSGAVRAARTVQERLDRDRE